VKLNSKIFLAMVGIYGFTTLAAQPAMAKDKVLANVNGTPITEADLKLAEMDIGAELGRMPEMQRRRATLEYLIQVRLLSTAARKDKLESGEAYKKRIDYFRERALRDTYFESKVMNAVTDAEAKEIYKKRLAAMPSTGQIRARHILVKTEAEARDVSELINRGQDFVELAKKKSTGPSGPRGGDLGYFSQGDMVKEFETAAFKLKVGQVSEPVKTKFGWHIIKIEDKRKAAPFEEVKDQVKTELIYKKAQEVLAGLRKAAKVEILDKVLKKAIETPDRGSFTPPPQ